MMLMDDMVIKLQKNILNIAVLGVMVIFAYKIFAAQQNR